MVAIIKELTTTTSPEKVYNALTQPKEIALWWTDDLSAQPKASSLAEFRFSFSGGHFVVQVEIAELDPNKKVYWVGKKGLGFEATTITWKLTSVENGTNLVFTQDGYAQADALYQQTSGIWDYFFSSLTAYFETGKGTPGFSENFFR
jgi:uncharacterized protein YndB with AHSA1/START domain